jgi:hypothetical protein
VHLCSATALPFQRRNSSLALALSSHQGGLHFGTVEFRGLHEFLPCIGPHRGYGDASVPLVLVCQSPFKQPWSIAVPGMSRSPVMVAVYLRPRGLCVLGGNVGQSGPILRFFLVLVRGSLRFLIVLKGWGSFSRVTPFSFWETSVLVSAALSETNNEELRSASF